MGTGYTFAFLVIGAVLVFVDGWLLRRSGTTYLSAVYPDGKVADSVNQLVTVLFHLTTLGVVALVSTLPMGGGDPFTAMVSRLGALFLVLAAAHGVTILILARMRSRQRDKVLQEEITSRTSEHFDAKPEAGTA
ncbi:MAG: hypothetical protein IJH84_23305 [Saccharopolyspora sp.]|uniref:hypothetical protein n=1 Tax=Saccharopolyspora TaxID=1835 RepID=UPI00190A4B36|nr:MULTISPECIES: hypothetical protein [unclassified Saccharopolyspora]MBK0865209.1 hypothetical protein [Saccharopolyspora sp. HNM0986]MBQ6643940.1 hypothetical protein [Saccharopolyspora sp.]